MNSLVLLIPVTRMNSQYWNWPTKSSNSPVPVPNSNSKNSPVTTRLNASPTSPWQKKSWAGNQKSNSKKAWRKPSLTSSHCYKRNKDFLPQRPQSTQGNHKLLTRICFYKKSDFDLPAPSAREIDLSF